MASVKGLIEFLEEHPNLKTGIVSINNKYFGKPGDTIHSIKQIEYFPENKTLQLVFFHEVIKIIDPTEIVFGSNNFKIVCKAIERITNSDHIKYSDSPSLLFENW